MSGSPLAVIVIPIVTFAALGLLIGIVLWASRRPGGKEHRARPRWNVAGGAFRGDPRQVVPTRDEEPPEAAAWDHREDSGGQH